MVVVVSFKKIIPLHYVIVTNHGSMVIFVNIFPHVRLNRATWAVLVYEMEQDLYVNVHRIELVANANIMIHVKYNHVLGMENFVQRR